MTDFKNRFQVSHFISLIIVLSLFTACAEEEFEEVQEIVEEEEEEVVVAPSKYLYVSSGACYSGAGNTTFSNLTASNVVIRIDTETGVRESILTDYNSSPAQAGDTPVGIADIDSDFFYVLVENTTTVSARRIEKVSKSVGGARSTFSANVTALSAQLRNLKKLPNGDLLISKSTGVEKINSGNARVTAGANPLIASLGGSCASSATLLSKVIPLNNGNLVFLHANAAQNKIGIVSGGGYFTTADCLAVQTVPIATAFPTAAFYDSENNKLIVAYAGNTVATNINSIYSYTINETNNTISDAQKIYDASLYPSVYDVQLYGISEMVYDSENSVVYIAAAMNTSTTVANYVIEKFNYDPTKIGVTNADVLTRATTTPFYTYGIDTKCISQMMVAE